LARYIQGRQGRASTRVARTIDIAKVPVGGGA
jgi:hypothetical protein